MDSSANNKKLSIAPISTSVKSILSIRRFSLTNVLGSTLSPNITRNVETTMAITIIPIHLEVSEIGN
jgi:hypothetical protein